MCNKANEVCDKAQYEEASFFEKMKLKIHIIYCRNCKEHSKKNSKLTEIIKKSKVECLDTKCKEAMKKTLDKALSENQH